MLQRSLGIQSQPWAGNIVTPIIFPRLETILWREQVISRSRTCHLDMDTLDCLQVCLLVEETQETIRTCIMTQQQVSRCQPVVREFTPQHPVQQESPQGQCPDMIQEANRAMIHGHHLVTIRGLRRHQDMTHGHSQGMIRGPSRDMIRGQIQGMRIHGQ